MDQQIDTIHSSQGPFRKTETMVVISKLNAGKWQHMFWKVERATRLAEISQILVIAKSSSHL